MKAYTSKRLEELHDRLESLRKIKANYMNSIKVKFKYYPIDNELEPILSSDTIEFLAYMDEQIEPVCDEIMEIIKNLKN